MDGRRAEVGLVEFKACCASRENNASGRQSPLPLPTLPQHIVLLLPSSSTSPNCSKMFKKYSDPFYPKTKHSHNDLTAFLHFTMMNLLLKTLGQLHSACSASEVGGKSQAGKRHNVQPH